MKRAFLLVFVFVLGALTEAHADAVGKRLYENYCAKCHGRLGAGSQGGTGFGPRISDLASRNGGVYPFDRVVRIIDGSDNYRAHGSPMPNWGSKFDRLFSLGREATENEGDAWIKSLARYVGELQQ